MGGREIRGVEIALVQDRPLLKLPVALKAILQRAREFLADRRIHEFLWFCVPGVLVALFLRVRLMVAMPYGYYHPDTHDFLTTAYLLVARHRWVVHGKTTFLTPMLYTLAFLPKVPALFVIPFAQHARGLLVVLGSGGLARLWFARWRWFIIPLTVLTGAMPSMIFWEHALMSESGFVFCAVMLAVAGTIFVLHPRRLTYGLLLFSMACVAAARPEGNLWQGVGVALVFVVFWGRWKKEWLKIAGALGVALVMLSITKTSHSGLLLYSSLVHLTPDSPRSVPGFGPYIAPFRDQMIVARRERVVDDVVLASRPVSAALAAYAKDHPHARLGLPINKGRKRSENAGSAEDDEPDYDLRYGNNVSILCRRLAIESAIAHIRVLPGYAWHKFLAPINEDPGGTFREADFHERQAFSIAGKPTISRALGMGLARTKLDTMDEARAFVTGHYPLGNVQWFNHWEAVWQGAVDYLHLPATRYSPVFELPGLPIYHLLALLGALAAIFRPTPARRFHWAFLPVVAGVWFIVMLTAAVIPRHRFVLEPFWLLYGFFLLDSLAALALPTPERRSAESGLEEQKEDRQQYPRDDHSP